MPTAQSQHRSTNWHRRSSNSARADRRRNRHGGEGFAPLWWRTVFLIGRGPKRLWPYVLPWLCVVLASGLALLIARDVLTRQLRVPPVETPQSLSGRGYTPAFLSARIMSSMREIGQDAESIPHDKMIDTDAQLDIPIPGQEVSYATMVRFVKDITQRKDVSVHIGITELDPRTDSYLAHVQIDGGPFNSHESTVKFEGRNIEEFVHEIAVKAMRLAEPNILASHLFSQVQKTRCSLAFCDYSEIAAIYDEVLAMPASEQGEWATAGKAWLLASQGKSKAKLAEDETRQALTVYKHSAVLRASLGIALEQQQRMDEALEALRGAAREESKTAENLRLLGDVLLHTKHYSESLDTFRQADKMKPDCVEILHDWGEALNTVGRYDDAIDKLSRAALQRPDDAPSHAELGRAFDHKGDLRAASRQYAQALRIDPTTLTAHENQLARLADTVEDNGVPGTPAPDVRARPVSNPHQTNSLQTSLEAPTNAEA